jgi:hypothetical protein
MRRGSSNFSRAQEGHQVGLDDLVVDVLVEVEEPDLSRGVVTPSTVGLTPDVGDARDLAAVGRRVRVA